MYLFRVKFNEGTSIKTIAEILKNNIKNKTVHFVLTKKGIFLNMVDNITEKAVFLDLKIDSEKCPLYVYKFKEKFIDVGLNSKFFFDDLSSKKKDKLEFFITSEDPDKFGILITKNDTNQTIKSSIKIQPVQKTDVDIDTEYSIHPVHIPSGEYYTMCKKFTQFTKDVNITYDNGMVKFHSDIEGIRDKDYTFGEKTVTNQDVNFTMVFETSKLLKLSKLAGISKTIKFYIKEDYPIYIKVENEVVDFNIFIKNDKLVQDTKDMEADEYDSDDCGEEFTYEIDE